MRVNHQQLGPFRQRVVLSLIVAAVVFIGSGLSAREPTNSGSGFLSPRTIAKGVMIPIFVEQDAKSVGILRVDRVFTEYQRKGLFRIGLLPQIVAEGVTVEFRQPDQIANVLGAIRSRLFATHYEAAAELRRIVIQADSGSAPLLQARSVRFDEAGRWQLRDGLISKPGTNPIRFTRAVLQPTGPLAGHIRYESRASTASLNLFSAALVPNSDPAGKL